MKQLQSKGALNILTSDWHPLGHISFASRHGKQPFDTIKVTYENGVITDQTMWPDHCVQNTKGAEFFKTIPQNLVHWIYRKGMKDVESYSIVTDESQRPASTIVEDLKKQGIQTILIGGLATDYCVFNSAKDFKAAGFDVYFISKLSAGVCKDTSDKAIKSMCELGIKVV